MSVAMPWSSAKGEAGWGDGKRRRVLVGFFKGFQWVFSGVFKGFPGFSQVF